MSSTVLKRALPLVVALALIALLVPFGEYARANHGSRSLDVSPEQQTKDPDATGEESGVAILTAAISSEPTFSTGALNIDFELEAGPHDSENSPKFPDKSCSIPVGQTSCQVSYDGTATGTDRWRVWIDHDGNNETTEADTTEGRNEQTAPGTPSTLLTGCMANQSEPDCTDVVEVKWSGLRLPGAIDCDDSGRPDTERETNTGEGGAAANERYTCHVFDENGEPLIDQDPDTTGDQRTTVYAENENGPNDQDDSTSYDTPDYTCQTTAGDEIFTGDNNCTIDITQAEGADGTAFICFWTEGGEDDGFAAAGLRHCGTDGEPVGENQKADGSDTANDLADRTELTWEDPAATSLDVESEKETLTLGSDRVLTATVYDQFGQQFAGNTVVKFEFFKRSPTDKTDHSNDGNSPATVDESCTTDDGPDCTLTYSQETTAGRDLICAFINANPPMNGTSRNASGRCAGEGVNDPDDTPDAVDAPQPTNDRVDVVETTWVNDPAATQLDCRPENSRGLVRSRHKVTCKASTDQPNSAIANTEVDVEITGANDPDNGDSPSTPDRTCTTNANGECTFAHGGGRGTRSAGNTFYRAWIDVDYDDSTVEADAEEGRNEKATAGAEEPDATDVVKRKWLSGDRTVSLNVTNNRVNRGKKVTFFGDVDAQAPSCKVGQKVKLKRRPPGGRFNTVRKALTDAKGNFSFRPFKIWKKAHFKAITPRNGACDWARSSRITVNTK